MTQRVTQRGYMSVSLNKGNVQKTVMVHNLVAAAFIENPASKPFVNHKDLNKKNNNATNLEWVTDSENKRHAIENGALTFKRGQDNHMHGRFNEMNHNSRAVAMVSENGEVIRTFQSAREAERQVDGATFRLISMCCTGRRKKHAGFGWRFVA